FHTHRWLFTFVLVEMACQLALLFPSLAGARVLIRSAAFGGSAALVVVLRGGRWEHSHPSLPAAAIALVVMAVSIANPNTNALTAGIATVVLNIAILGPIVWAPRIRIDAGVIRKLLLLFWGFNTLSAVFGALQMYFPGRFQPAIASILADRTNYLQSLHITLANGARVYRPMGLTDTPGGAGLGGVYSVLFGSAFLSERPRPWQRAILLAGMAVGLFALYLSQVRCYVVVLAIGLVAMAAPYVVQRRTARFMTILTAVGAVGIVGFVLAVAVGGDAVTRRLSTLLNGDPGQVYYSNRGTFLEDTIYNLVPQYPLGAGLGRWGMISTYFGDLRNPLSRPLWAEIQWTGWLYDGGVPLMLVYLAAMLIAVREILGIAARRDPGSRELHPWACAIFGYSVGMVALTFNCCPFETTVGLDFWLLNAALFAASRQAIASPGS
ncbi:MAG: hypothetical protein ACREJ3_18275, partial [Polyangiaceae bacterium]